MNKYSIWTLFCTSQVFQMWSYTQRQNKKDTRSSTQRVNEQCACMCNVRWTRCRMQYRNISTKTNIRNKTNCQRICKGEANVCGKGRTSASLLGCHSSSPSPSPSSAVVQQLMVPLWPTSAPFQHQTQTRPTPQPEIHHQRCLFQPENWLRKSFTPRCMVTGWSLLNY